MYKQPREGQNDAILRTPWFRLDILLFHVLVANHFH